MPDDRLAVLAALYASTGGPRWANRQRWGSIDDPPCKRFGIECVKRSITSIDLGGNRARGTLPSQLASLSALKVLNIDESALSGTLPRGLSTGLSVLDTLLLASNRHLSGTLPPDLGAITTLRTLDLSGNRVSGTLASAALAKWTLLQRLQLDHTALSGTIPPAIGQLSSATSLFVHASYNLSGTLPTQMGRLTSLLDGVSFANTRLSGTLPTELGQLSKLRALWMTHTRLSGSLPSALGQMRSLSQLELHRNALSGRLPTELGGLKLRRGCVLTVAQAVQQPRHSMRPVDKAEPDTNHFHCPLPLEALPAPCRAHLACVESVEAGQRGAGQSGRGLLHVEQQLLLQNRTSSWRPQRGSRNLKRAHKRMLH